MLDHRVDLLEAAAYQGTEEDPGDRDEDQDEDKGKGSGEGSGKGHCRCWNSAQAEQVFVVIVVVWKAEAMGFQSNQWITFAQL